VKQFEQPGLSQADELLHLPDKPAGVDEKEQRLLAPNCFTCRTSRQGSGEPRL
jgi:hypothetical protein